MLDITAPATTGLVLGLSAGLSPGPLLTLMLSETLRHGIRAGFMVAMAPICSDLPIIALALGMHWLLPDHRALEIGLGLVGGVYLTWIGLRGLKPRVYRASIPIVSDTAIPSLRKAVMVNLLNPNPYIFWLTIGVPAMTQLLHHSLNAAVLFVASFYTLLVGSKAVVAVLVGRSACFLGNRPYILSLKILSLILCGYGFLFICRSVKAWTGA